ncbi:MAG: arylamine N-acetyltransferase [Nitrospirales bacterium]
MTTSIDLDAYFQRIGYEGERTPTLETLQAIQLRHAETIAFENLNALTRWPVRLDIESLQQKLVRDGRGGYCYEQNLLFSHVLKAIGFQVTGLAARVLWNEPDGAITPRSHMLLCVELNEKPYIADVGFGILTPTGPLRLELDVEQATPHEPFRLTRAGQEFVMQAKIRGDWKTLYRFDLQEQFLSDYEVSNWYVSTHPDSIFFNGLMTARPATDCRYALRNNEFAVHHLNGSTDRRILTSVAEMRETLERAFRITLPNAPELDAALARLTAQTG